jgi:hypothetical protein
VILVGTISRCDDRADSVVSALAGYDDPAASQVAEQLDAEVLDLLRHVSGLPPQQAG